MQSKEKLYFGGKVSVKEKHINQWTVMKMHYKAKWTSRWPAEASVLTQDTMEF
jgi:tetrahydrodipicolinate N-succinyltransferase